MDRDPNEGSTDPMVPEHWLLGESVQDHLLATGYEQEGVDGIAVDIHDILQAADLIREELAPAILKANGEEDVRLAATRLMAEFRHLEWHGQAGRAYLEKFLSTAPQ